MTPDHTPAAPSAPAPADNSRAVTPDEAAALHRALIKSVKIIDEPAPAEVPMPEPDACPMCAGEGSVRSHTTHLGPDDYDYDENCPACYGTGSADMADAINALGYWEHRTDITRIVVERAAVLRIVEARSAYADAREAAAVERVRGVLREFFEARDALVAKYASCIAGEPDTGLFGELLEQAARAEAAARAELGDGNG